MARKKVDGIRLVLASQSGQHAFDPVVRQLVILNYSARQLTIRLGLDEVGSFASGLFDFVVNTDGIYITPDLVIPAISWIFAAAAPLRPYAFVYAYSAALFDPGKS